MSARVPVTIGVDTGGTFTDLVRVRGEEVVAGKLPSTPDDPAAAVLAGIAEWGTPRGVRVVHGTTVALNALLQGKTARAAFVTNEGFADLLEIGRQDRPELYALHPEKPVPLVPRELRFEIAQRSAPDPARQGTLETWRRPTRAQLAALLRALRAAAPQSVAVGLLHSYADPTIEREVAAALRPLGVPITCSAELMGEHREYERFSTAAANAALVPIVRDYLTRLAADLGARRLDILQSSGGTLPAADASLEPVRVLFSGPAGGVLGAARAAREAGFEQLVALDMGGTSTDVAFHAAGGRLVDTRAFAPKVAGHPIGVPTLDIHTIGTGGGSLVRCERGRLLVGPQSAGADPGPVAYGRGDTLTVTDAHVMLGHLSSRAFVGGRVALDSARVHDRFSALAARLGTSAHEAAEAVLEVARAAMRRAIGVMTMQRGKDPADLPLVAFGGAGGLHAAALAASLGMRGALIPRLPGCLSAWGMAVAPPQRDASRTLLVPLHALTAGARSAQLRALEQRCARELRAGGARGPFLVERVLELRYAGQTWTLALDDPGGPAERVAGVFHELHEQRYGWALLDRAIELVTARVRLRGEDDVPRTARPRPRVVPRRAHDGERAVHFAGLGRRVATLLRREELSPGHHFRGPAIVEELTGTTLVPPDWRAEVRAGGHLWLEDERSR